MAICAFGDTKGLSIIAGGAIIRSNKPMHARSRFMHVPQGLTGEHRLPRADIGGPLFGEHGDYGIARLLVRAHKAHSPRATRLRVALDATRGLRQPQIAHLALHQEERHRELTGEPRRVEQP